MRADLLARLLPETLYLVLWVSAPVLAAALVVGLVIAVVSTTTQVQDPAVSYVPRFVAVALALAAAGAWMTARLVGFTDQLWRAIPDLVIG